MQRNTVSAAVCFALLSLAIHAIIARPAPAQVYRQSSLSTTTPDRVETRLGALDFKDGAPSLTTVQRVYDNLDFTHAINAFLDTFQGANMCAVRDGVRGARTRDNQILIFSDLIDSKSLFLTADADAVCFLSVIDLSTGPMVFEAPPKSQGILNDMWSRWVIDFGAIGPDRGEGGKYLILPPGYEGTAPEGGFYVSRCRTNRACILGRAFMEKDDPKPVAERIKKTAKIYPYEQGGAGTSIAELLTGKYRGTRAVAPSPTVFVEGSGKSISAIPSNDFSFFETINGVVQHEPADALSPELMGQLAAIGIVKGKIFKPDARMKKILAEAAAVGNATARGIFWNPRESEGFAYYPGSSWNAPLWISGYDFMTPPSLVSRLGVRPQPSTGARTLDARSSFFYAATGVSPTTCMRMPGIGCQCLVATVDAGKNYFDGAKTYKVKLPKDIPQADAWSMTVYDNQTRSMLQTSQRCPKVGSQNYPRPAATADTDGSTEVYFGPKAPKGMETNWIQTVSGKGWFAILRLHGPLEPFFTKAWRPSEIELVK
jgi:hypothetical protein